MRLRLGLVLTAPNSLEDGVLYWLALYHCVT